MQFTALFLSLVAVASAAPAELVGRAATTCGSVYYSAAQVNAAAQAACDYVTNGSTAGSSTYPHKYNNYEGFNFPVSAPYYEFPIKSGGVYTGGSPGADRVVINKSCALAGVITHTGASGNNFVGCSGKSTTESGDDKNSSNDSKSGNNSTKSAAVAAKCNNVLGAVSGAGAAVLLYIL